MLDGNVRTTFRLVVNPERVKRERLVRGVYPNGDRSFLGNGDFQGRLVPGRYVDVARDLGTNDGILIMTQAVL